ncbi:MAG TPA: potassium/proton antiporter [Gemmatimonadales bacterium]|jgi:cell volume regulation protein A|nr:potassium/proton antiporter [Gemmatimonadales bacterium]
MPAPEPTATAIGLTAAGVLLALSVLSSRALDRVSVPVALIFLVIGVLAGSEGLGGIAFDDYPMAFRLGTVALVLILFDGGLNTPIEATRRAARPAVVLATLGVVGIAAVLALAGRLIGLEWQVALLVGAIVSSTDAAAVFAVLRGSGLQLQRRVGATLELESGLNDPMAIILTTTLAREFSAAEPIATWRIPLDVLVQLAVGTVMGVAVGVAGRATLGRLRLSTGGLYPVLTLALALLAYGLATLLSGSGFLAVYLAGLVLGNGMLPFRAGLLRVHDALAWLAQVSMFLMLGLLVFPSRLAPVAVLGSVLALILAVVVRPAVVASFLAPFRYPRKEVLYIGWVGLRGAVPIVLAIVPILEGVPGADYVFNVVFFIVVVSALIPGATVPWATRRLGLEAHEPPAPPAALQIESRTPLRGDLLSFHIDPALAVVGVSLAELPFPDGAAAALIVRGQELLPPRGSTVLLPGDHIYIVARPEDRPLVQLLFGRPEAG